ncbi:MAG TPA: hypothetical protein VI385_12460 [Flavisolibacter sp.]
MFSLSRLGRTFYGLGIIAYGTQQVVIRDFRPQIVPGFPSWAHTYSVFPIVTGLAMIAVGVLVAGIIKVDTNLRKKLSLYMGFYFLALIPLSHIPYLLFVYPHKLSHLGSWGDLLKVLAFAGASFTVAGSFLVSLGEKDRENRENRIVKAMIPVGRFCYCTTIILFGCNHFVYDISFMVPKWFGMPGFWSYFGGAALIAAGVAILFRLFTKPVALLLALMLFLWFCLLHVPNAIANPYSGRGNSIVSAFDALVFCGTALIISGIGNRYPAKIRDKIRSKDVKVGADVSMQN